MSNLAFARREYLTVKARVAGMTSGRDLHLIYDVYEPDDSSKHLIYRRRDEGGWEEYPGLPPPVDDPFYPFSISMPDNYIEC